MSIPLWLDPSSRPPEVEAMKTDRSSEVNDKFWNPKTQLKRVANLRFKENQGMAVLIIHF
jgi:hypothetical protein